MALKFPSEFPEVGDIVRVNITIYSSSNPPTLHPEIIDAMVMRRRKYREESSFIYLVADTYQELEFINGKWRCCWLQGRKHEVKLSILHKAR